MTADLVDYRSALDAMIAEEKAMLLNAKASWARFKKRMNSPIFPENMIGEGIVKISYISEWKEVTANFYYSPEFTEAAHKAHMKWSGTQWYYRVTYHTKWEDVEAEIATVILACGFAVKVDMEARDKIILGNYEPEYVRWIETFKDDSYSVHIRVGNRYDSRFSGMYQEAKNLPGAKYSSEYISVGIKQYEKIEAFAEANGYRISERAQELLDTYKATTKVRVTPKKVQLDSKIKPLSGDDLLAELRDD